MKESSMSKEQSENTIMNDSRRQFLRGLSTMVGGVAAGTLLTGNGLSVAMAYTQNSSSQMSDGKVFNQAQLQLLKEICAIVIPKTETLGAAEVDTHGFIDNQLFHCFEQNEQSQIINVLTLVENIATTHYASTFVGLASTVKFQLLTDLDRGKNHFDQQQRADFKRLKQLICFGYYTSEVGASQELRYVAIPGGFKGSIKYKLGDATWGSNGLQY
jgi:carboxypeptidase C (cathepsin A)